jgi:hypothetical protein
MLSDPARESLRYAFDRAMVQLYALALLGLLVWNLSAGSLFLGLPRLFGALLEILLFLAGLGLFVGAVVAVLHRLLRDTLGGAL